MFQPTLASIARKSFEHQRLKKVFTCRALGDTRPALFRHCFETFPGARNYFWDVVPQYDGSNISRAGRKWVGIAKRGLRISSRS
eukprot:9084757-Pyramimonas_sp.AAC.1